MRVKHSNNVVAEPLSDHLADESSLEKALTDNHGRRFRYLRLSVTDVCNFSCSYCLPDGYHCHGQKKSNLNTKEITHLLSAFAALGTEKVRLTGGEPSVRKDLTQIIEIAAKTRGVNQVAITTNGYKLKENITAWKEAGLTALNISMDSLDPQRFYLITGHNSLKKLLQGLELALELGLKVKTNAVLLKGVNSHQLPLFLDFVKNKPISLRFIELMQTGDNQQYFSQHHLAAEKVVSWLTKRGWQQQPRSNTAGPAIEYANEDHLGKIGIIAPYSKDFCKNCNRLRVSSEGNLHLCLFASSGHQLRELLQQASQQPELIQRLQNLLQGKEAQHYLQNGYTGATYNLSMLGG